MTRLAAALLAALALLAPPPDALPLAGATLTGGADVRDWPVVTSITRLETGPHGLEVDFDRKASGWPDVTPPGWDGPVYYTVWLGTLLPDGLHLAASLVSYRGQAGAGAGDVTNVGQYATNLWYLDPALQRHQVGEGDTLYLLVTAGALRGLSSVTLRERSQLVAFAASRLPRVFTYDGAAPPPPPPPVPDPPAGPDYGPRVLELERRMGELEAAARALAVGFGDRLQALEAKPIPTSCSAGANLGFARVPVSCKLTY